MDVDSTNKSTRYKVRVVARGFTQVQGVDYNETFASVSRMESLRAILHIAAVNDWEIHQMDVKTAFLHGTLDEDIYMEQPEGMEEPGKEDWVAKLEKSLYGLKQAGRMWMQKLHQSMTAEGFEQSTADHSLYLRKTQTGQTMASVHVDDMAVAGTSKSEIERARQDLSKHFELIDEGLCHKNPTLKKLQDASTSKKPTLSRHR